MLAVVLGLSLGLPAPALAQHGPRHPRLKDRLEDLRDRREDRRDRRENVRDRREDRWDRRHGV
jgi:hypothetical protein